MNQEREPMDPEASVVVLGLVVAVCMVAAIVRFAGFV
jgi:hypothetical protein